MVVTVTHLHGTCNHTDINLKPCMQKTTSGFSALDDD